VHIRLAYEKPNKKKHVQLHISMISQLLALTTIFGAIVVPPKPGLAQSFDFDPTLDGRKEIAKYNKFMDDIFARMNAAIKAKNLDPMDLKLLPNPDKTPRSTSPARLHDVRKVKAWLYGMSSLQRTGDVSIFFHPNHRTIQCPFALGPLELRVIKTLDGSTSSAAAVTDTMLGLMDMQIDEKTSSAAITDVYFDEPGGVSVTGNLKRKRAHLKHNSNGYSPYRMEVASRAKKSLEQVARLVVASDKK